MKKIFSLFAAVLMAGSMMANWSVTPVKDALVLDTEDYHFQVDTVGSNKTDAVSSNGYVKFSSGKVLCYIKPTVALAVNDTLIIHTKGGSSGSDAAVNLNGHQVTTTIPNKTTDPEAAKANYCDTLILPEALDSLGFSRATSGTIYLATIEYRAYVAPAPVVNDTVFFVNAADWAAVKVHAWGGTATGTTWPGLDATKADYQLQGKDVYYFVAAPGAYANCLFTNNGIEGQKTADLIWTEGAGKYYYNGAWKTRAELEAPVVSDMYIKHGWVENAWTWKQMTYDAETETYLLREIYGATGCNWNTAGNDTGATWVANPTVVGNPVAGDSAIFALKNGVITITKIGEPSPEPTARFLKHNWGGLNAWTWKEMAREGETSTYTLRDIYGGTGCNWNVVGNDAGSTWVATPTLVGEPAVGDSAVFSLVEGVITITKIESEGPGPEPEPEIIDTLYLVNSKGWGTPKIYFYGGTVGQITAWPGDNMTKVNGVQADGFDVYMFSITRGEQANVIFNNGGSVQSGDLVIAGNEGKYFNFADQTWYESTEAVVCTWYLNANYNGTAEWRELTRGEGTFTRRDVYAPAANYYYNGMAADKLKSEIKGAKLTIDSNLAAGDSATFTLDPYAKTINVEKIAYHIPDYSYDTIMLVAGNFTNWAEGMQVLPYTVSLPKDSTLEFKQVRIFITTRTLEGQDPVITRDTTWYGQQNEGGYMTRESSSWWLDGNFNVLLTTDAAGEYTFSLNENDEFTVTFPVVGPTGINNIEAGKAVKMIENGHVVIIRDGKRYNAVGAQL